MIKSFAFASLTVALLFGAMPAHAGIYPNALTVNAITSNALTNNALISNALTNNALTNNALNFNGRSIQGLSQQGTTKDTPSGFRVVEVELPASR